MTRRDDDFGLKPGPIRDRGPSSRRATGFVGEVVRAARKAGHTGYHFGSGSRSDCGYGYGYGRGRFARASRALGRSARRVTVKARIVRHRGPRFRSSALAKHIGYLAREGTGQDAARGELFGREETRLEGPAFAAACEDDRHHFRFIVSPEDASDLEDLRVFTRDLMSRAERDLGTRLNWLAVDHWNTDNPHVHILVRGKADDGRDLVIARDYISRGFRARAEGLVQLELGPRSAREVATSLAAEVVAGRWTGLDRALRSFADESGGVADLRPGTPEPRDPELRRLMIGRAQKLERMGLARRLAPAVWELKPGTETVLRELGTRDDIIKRMHQSQAGGPERPMTDFAIEGAPASPILGRLVERGLHDDHAGTGYAIIDGVDGRVHHLQFRDIEATGDTLTGGIVETRLWTPKSGGSPQLALVGRSDLSLAAQIEANGATWLDRLHLARNPAPLSNGGFGAEVRQALEHRADRLVAEGLARRQGQRVIFSRDLLVTLRSRELDRAAAHLASQSGLPRRRPTKGDGVEGIYRRRLDLASGRFAMIDDGLGFALVPWSPQIERYLGREVAGLARSGGGIAWTLGRQRGLSP